MQKTIRPLATADDYLACTELQRETWGAHFADCVPPGILQISQKLGGVAAGAFDGSDRMLGFVFGLSGWRNGEPCHWSHMLAVREESRNLGLGRDLKEFQRRTLLSQGIDVMYWTYDPLVARNAHLNLQKLGVEVVEYLRDMYGVDQESITDSVIGSDRFVVRWHLEGGSSRRAVLDANDEETAPLAVVEDVAGETRIPEGRVVKIEIPSDIQALKQVLPDVARGWRSSTRRVFEAYLGKGYEVVRFKHDPETQRSFYYLMSSSSPNPDHA